MSNFSTIKHNKYIFFHYIHSHNWYWIYKYYIHNTYQYHTHFVDHWKVYPKSSIQDITMIINNTQIIICTLTIQINWQMNIMRSITYIIDCTPDLSTTFHFGSPMKISIHFKSQISKNHTKIFAKQFWI